MNNLERRLPEDWGIDPVPQAKRRLGPFDFAVLWGDLAVSLLVMVAGSLLVPGLSTQQAVLAIVIGTLSGTILLALAGLACSGIGVPTMVAMRPALGIRGSYFASGLNVMQLIGWAGLEIIIMAQAARAMSDHYVGFSGYYFWILFFGVLGTAMAIGGPVTVVRQWMAKFGVWIVAAASLWLTYHLFDAYDMNEIWNREGAGGFPNFWQGVDLVVALPASWLPLVGDYSRFARAAVPAALGTYGGYVIANGWFFMLGMLYVQALESNPGEIIDALVMMILPLTLGWLALFVLVVGETDEAFANIYSTAVSSQNLWPRIPHWALTLVVGAAAIVVAISVDLIQYENFLLLIGGVFVPAFGVFLSDYFAVRNRHVVIDGLYRDAGPYWYAGGFNLVGLGVWLAGFLLYAHAAQPPWLLLNADFVSWAPTWMTHVGGTVPAFLFSFGAYWLGMRLLMPSHHTPPLAESSAG